MLDRIKLINDLQELQSDEFDSNEAMYLTEVEIVDQIIQSAYYYKNLQNGNNEGDN